MTVLKKENILLLIHGDALVDSSNYNRTIKNSGVSIESTEKHFSQHNCLKYNGGAKSFYVSNLINGTMDYTIDFWYKATSNKDSMVFFSHGGSNNASGGVYSITNTYSHWWATGFRIKYFMSTSDSWKHFACVRKSGVTTMYINGSKVGSSTYNPSFSNSVERFGWNDSYSGEYYEGYIQELRVCDVAVWDTNFNPPTDPYITSDLKTGNITLNPVYIGGANS